MHGSGRTMVLALVLAVTAAAASGQDPSLPDPGLPGGGLFTPAKALDFGFGLQLDRPYQEPGGRGVATIFFFNLTPWDADGAMAQIGGLGCRYHVFVRDARDDIVWRPVPCGILGPGGGEPAAPAGPFPFPSGTFLEYAIDMDWIYGRSDTADPDGEPLPGGAYTLEAVHDYGGPVLPGPGIFTGGGVPRAEVPFRIVRCDGAAGPMPVSELDRGIQSMYRLYEQEFYGEDMVFRTEEAALEFWRMHTGGTDPPPSPPRVDFRREMVVASVLGSHASGVEILGVEEYGCRLLVQVRESRDPLGAPVRTNPYHFVAVPRSLKEVHFLHAVQGDGNDGAGNP